MKKLPKLLFVTIALSALLGGCGGSPNTTLVCIQKHDLFVMAAIPNNPSPIELKTPVLFEDIYSFGSIYGTPDASYDENHNPIPHVGIDFQALKGTPFIAAAPGVVSLVEIGRDNYGPTLSIEIRYNGEYTVVYTFEPIKDRFVDRGSSVRVKDQIGTIGHRELCGRHEGQFVHFGLKRGNTWVCPVRFFNPEVRRKLNTIRKIKLTEQGMGFWLKDSPNLCRCPEHQILFSESGVFTE